MIPLRFRFEGKNLPAEPFVLRADRRLDGPPDKNRAAVVRVEKTRLVLQSAHGEIALRCDDPEQLIGDVLLFQPASGTGLRLIRSDSAHNTLVLTERCDQLCVMCSQPPTPNHTDLFEQYRRACLLAPRGCTIGLSGGEPTLYRDDLFEMIEAVHGERSDIRFHILTNAQHFEEGDAARLRSRPFRAVLWGVPLYGPVDAVHDLIVGKEGAFAKLADGFDILARAGAAIELRTVVMTLNIDLFPRLSRYVANNLSFIQFWAIMQLERFGYGKLNYDSLFFDHSKDFRALAKSLHYTRARGLPVLLYNMPLCTVPPEFRDLAVPSISDWKRKFLPACGGCARREDCTGFFEWYNPAEGFSGVEPIL